MDTGENTNRQKIWTESIATGSADIGYQLTGNRLREVFLPQIRSFEDLDTLHNCKPG